MKLSDTYRLAVKLLRKQATINQNKVFVNRAGEKVSTEQVADCLEKISHWVFPELSSEDVALVVRCKKCRFYEQHTEHGAKLKPRIFYACNKDMNRRDPMFFCKEGESK